MRKRSQSTKTVATFCVILATLILGACSSQRSGQFQLSQEDYAVSSEETRRTTVYLTGTRPIDSLAPGQKLLADISRLETDSFPEQIKAFVRVFDSTGNFITNMAEPYYKGKGSYTEYWSAVAEDLIGSGDDKRRESILNYKVREYGTGDSIPYVISLVLDHGGSMGGAISALQDGAEIFVNLKRSYDKIALIKFSNEPRVVVPLTDKKNHLLSNLSKDGLDGYGLYTALYRAAFKGVDVLKNAPPESPRVMVLFTDGEDNNSDSNAIQVYNYAKKHNVHIFPIGFGYSNDDTLRALAERTGGKFYKAYSREELSAVFMDIYLSLRNFYELRYTPPGDLLKHELDVQVSPPGRDRIIAEAGYDKSILEEIAWIWPPDDVIALGNAIASNDNSANRSDNGNNNRENPSQDGQNNGNTNNGNGNRNNSTGDNASDIPSPIDVGNVAHSGNGRGIDIPSNVFFDYDQDTLRSVGKIYLRKLAEDLIKHKRVELRIVGHTDNRGTEEYNLALSRRRAKAVVDYLARQGVASSRLQWDGKGYLVPLASNESEEGRARNRRVEFFVLRK